MRSGSSSSPRTPTSSSGGLTRTSRRCGTSWNASLPCLCGPCLPRAGGPCPRRRRRHGTGGRGQFAGPTPRIAAVVEMLGLLGAAAEAVVLYLNDVQLVFLGKASRPDADRAPHPARCAMAQADIQPASQPASPIPSLLPAREYLNGIPMVFLWGVVAVSSCLSVYKRSGG